MGVLTSIVAENDGWPDVVAEVNAWRGRCVAVLSQGEAAVSEMLLTLSQVEGRTPPVRLPQLIGQRIVALRHALSPAGAFHAEGAGAIDALDAFAACQALRNFLCHAPGTITRQRSGEWMLVLELLTFVRDRPVRRTLIIRQAERVAEARKVHAIAQRLQAKLALLRDTIT